MLSCPGHIQRKLRGKQGRSIPTSSGQVERRYQARFAERKSPNTSAPRYLKGISLVMESVKVSSTRQINAARGELGRLRQGRFFDRALRRVKEY
jgi:hypothetical protein